MKKESPRAVVAAWRRRLASAHIPVGPACKPVLRALYRVHVVARDGLAWAVRFFWSEPLFRARCESVGAGLWMERLPYIHGSGRIVIGRDVRLSGKPGIGFSSRGGADPVLDIGDGTFIGHDCGFGVASSIRIGRRCLLAARVSVRDSDGHPVDAAARARNEPTPPEGIAPVLIGDDVWIGAGSTILKGVTIGDRAVVGAASVVTGDVPPDTVVAGNPARVVKRLAAEAGQMGIAA